MVTRRSLRGLSVFAALVTLTASCEIDTIVIPRQERSLVVHAILNTSERTQTVIVERMIAGGTVTGSTIVDGVERVADAVVTITIPGGRVILLREIIDTIEPTAPGQKATIDRGRYTFSLDVERISLTPGGTYALKIVTPANEVVTGTTKIPGAPAVSTFPTVIFNRDRDSLLLGWSPATGAAAYWLRVDGAGSSYTQFLEENRIVLDGGLRTFDDDELKDVFVPGYVSTATVAAVDRNVYDYFRTGNDPFTGSGLLMHLEGASGVFGSATIVQSTRADVTLDKRHPLDGRYAITSATGSTEQRRASDFRLFVDTTGVDEEGRTIFFGTYQRGANGGRDRAWGYLLGADLIIQLYSGDSDVPIFRYRAIVKGDTLDGAFVDDGLKAVYVRR